MPPPESSVEMGVVTLTPLIDELVEGDVLTFLAVPVLTFAAEVDAFVLAVAGVSETTALTFVAVVAVVGSVVTSKNVSGGFCSLVNASGVADLDALVFTSLPPFWFIVLNDQIAIDPNPKMAATMNDIGMILFLIILSLLLMTSL